jgi:hypothetical protein
MTNNEQGMTNDEEWNRFALSLYMNYDDTPEADLKYSIENIQSIEDSENIPILRLRRIAINCTKIIHKGLINDNDCKNI